MNLVLLLFIIRTLRFSTKQFTLKRTSLPTKHINVINHCRPRDRLRRYTTAGKRYRLSIKNVFLEKAIFLPAFVVTDAAVFCTNFRSGFLKETVGDGSEKGENVVKLNINFGISQAVVFLRPL